MGAKDPAEIERTRRETDESLRSERRRTDDVLKVSRGPAKEALREFREFADDAARVARKAQKQADRDEEPDTSELVRALERERRAAEEALRAERARSDEVLRLEREGAPGSALHGERARTDRRLIQERDVADERRSGIEEPFRILVEQVKEYAIFLLDPEGTVISWNAGAERLKGYRQDEIVGRNFSVFYPEEEARADKPREELRIATLKGSVEMEGWRIRKDGTRFLANVVITALRHDDGTLRGFAKVTRDVTERFTSAERALQRSEETLRLALEATELGTWDWNLIDDEIVWSDQCRAMFGLDAKEPLSFEACLAVLHPEDRPRVREAVRRALEPSASGAWNVELRAVRSDGTVRWIASRGRVIFANVNGETRARRFLGTALDITARKEAEQELERIVRDLDLAVKARDEFVAVLTHDLRNPISAISLGASMLLRHLPAGMVGPRKRAESIRTSAERAGRMIEDLLQEIALEGRTVTLAIQAQDTRALVSEVFALFEPGAHERNISLTVDVPADLRPVRCDHDYALRVFENLLGNAKKFTPPGGEIKIRAEPAGDEVRFSVSDSGPGIVPEQRKRLFQRGYRAARQEPGLGLGLAIAKGIVEAHGGEIGVESSQGRGSTFWFTLRAA